MTNIACFSFTGDVHQAQLLEWIRFYCVHCLNDEKPTIWAGVTFDDVSDHWLLAHEFNHIPFQFYAVSLLSCYHCKEIGTYDDLVEHHEKNHPNTAFIITDQMNTKKCGMCKFQDGNLVDHFKLKHDPNSTQKLSNPICYSEEQIAELLKINVIKKLQCGKCYAVFKTKDQIGKHFKYLHNGENVESIEFMDNSCPTPVHLICGHCNEKVATNRYLEHLSKHIFNFRCIRCPEQSSDLTQMIIHAKIVHGIDSFSNHYSEFSTWMKEKYLATNIVYGNGLVFKAYNLLHTKYDDSHSLDAFIQNYLDALKARAEKYI